MTLHLNGEARAFPALRTVADFIAHLAQPAATLLVEHNGTALRRDEWRATPLRDGDRIELLRIAAGG